MRLLKFANLNRVLLSNPVGGEPFKEGDTMPCGRITQTMEKIAQGGGEDFYQGNLAREIVADLQEVGSPITLEDMLNYRAKWREPVVSNFTGGSKLFSVPPPGSGSSVALMLNILQGYNFTAKDSQNPLFYHRFIEAMKFAYAERMVMGDEDFVNGMRELVVNMTSQETANIFRAKIDDSKTHQTAFYLTKASSLGDHGTAHTSIVDSYGDAVSLTSTVNVYMGSSVVGLRTGIVFNDEMDDFSKPGLFYFEM